MTVDKKNKSNISIITFLGEREREFLRDRQKHR